LGMEPAAAEKNVAGEQKRCEGVLKAISLTLI